MSLSLKNSPAANTQGQTLEEARTNLRSSDSSGGVKRADLIRHIEQQGCELLRKGCNHTIEFSGRTIE
jgi:hypothetical protein